MNKRHIAIGSGLLIASVGASALGLGRASGVPLIGRTLDVSVATTLAAGESTNLCPQVDVFYADSRVDGSRVQVSVEPGATPEEPRIRIRSNAIVDEPIVTVFVRAGCAVALQRRYVMFAEFVSDSPSAGAVAPAAVAPAPPVALTPIASLLNAAATGPQPLAPATAEPQAAPAAASTARAAATSVPAASAATAAAPAAAPAAAAPAPATPAPAAAPKPARPKQAAEPARAPKQQASATPKTAPAKAPAPAAASEARLKLDTAVPAAEKTAQLRSASSVSLSPEDPAKRANAAAEWKALSQDASAAQREAQRVQTLETEAKAQRDALQKVQASLAQVQAQLQQERDERYLNPFTYALMGLLVLALGAAGFLFTRLRSASARRDWWQVDGGLTQEPRDETRQPGTTTLPPAASTMGPQTSTFAPSAAAPSVAAPVPVAPVRVAPAVPAAPPPVVVPPPPVRPAVSLPPVLRPVGPAPGAGSGGGSAVVRLDPAAVAEVFRLSEPGALPEADEVDTSASERPEFVNSLSTAVRAVSAEELLDVQQQADFFVSLGQHDQAIEVLRGHINDNPETSPLAYLDLLAILHELQRRDEYASLRDGFMRKFAVDVPEYEHFGEQSEGLERYGRALSRIEALWPGPRALELLEESIFKGPSTDGSEVFDLEAYRELLMLYALAKEIARTDGDDWGKATPAASSGQADPSTMTKTLIQPLSAAMNTQFRKAPDAAAMDIDLDLGLDGGDGGAAASATPAAPAPEPAADMSLDFDLPEVGATAAAPAPTSAPAAASDDMSLDFDLPPIDPGEPKKPS